MYLSEYCTIIESVQINLVSFRIIGFNLYSNISQTMVNVLLYEDTGITFCCKFTKTISSRDLHKIGITTR